MSHVGKATKRTSCGQMGTQGRLSTAAPWWAANQKLGLLTDECDCAKQLQSNVPSLA